MNVQLIVFPQTHDGFYNSTSYPVNNQLLPNGNFLGLNSTSAYGYNGNASNVQQLSITAQPPVIQNQWYRYHTSGGSTYASISAPQNVAGSACNFSGATVTQQNKSGVYIRIAGLTPGTQYTVSLDIDTSADGDLYLNILNPNTYAWQHQEHTSPAVASAMSDTFMWHDTELVIAIEWEGWIDGIGQSCTINRVKMFETQNPTNLVFEDLADGQVICDLYEDEDIPLTLSVDEFKNTAEQVQSYSKAFNLPATKRNNQIFDNMFEITRTADGTLAFNPYIKTQCILKQEGFILFEGYLRMLDINDKEGEISYNVNLYSEAIALADSLKDRKFSDLDFTELEHDYEKQNIKRSWNDSPDPSLTYLNASTSGFRDAYTTLRYPFIDWSHSIAVGGSNNSSATVGNPELLLLEDAFRPCINIKYLIDRIFNQPNFPFTYSSTLFNTTDFKKLYMDFNWGSGKTPVIASGTTELTRRTSAQTVATSYGAMIFETIPPTFNAPDAIFGYDDSTGVFTAQENSQSYTINYALEFENTGAGSQILDVEWRVSGSNGFTHNPVTTTIAASGTFTYSNSFSAPYLTAADTIQCVAKNTSGGSGIKLKQQSTPMNTYVWATTSVNQTTNDSLLGTLRGEIGQWEFLKGLTTMFNIITIPDPDNPNNIIFEPYADVFINDTASGTVSDLSLKSRGIEHDWTEKIDVSDIKLVPLTDLNKKTIFKFVEDDEDYVFNVYKNSVFGHLYGSKVYDASAFTLLDGQNEIVAEPFAATVPKPLMTQYPDFITPAIYSYNPDDGTSSGFDNSPRIFYNNGVKSSGTTYFIPAQNGFSNENQSDFLQFSHLTDIPTVVSLPPSLNDTQDFHFGECQLVQPIGGATVNNLFNMYWQPYYNELYNPDTRTMTIKVNLNPADINTFNFYDTVMIKNRQFRVNRIDYKPNDLSVVEFILIP